MRSGEVLDIATGYFEIGALLALAGAWQKLGSMRLLMGDEVSRRTQQAFQEAMSRIISKLDASIEVAKEADDFLLGVPAIVHAVRAGQIQTRVYRREKFHAKAYIAHGENAAAMVGSSNFTYPGLHQNVELNLRVDERAPELHEWFESYWNEAEEVTPELLRIIERHVHEYTPFEVTP